MNGVLEILNVGLGDMRITWNRHDDAEVARAQEMIENLLRQGYAILVLQEDGTYQRAAGFDREHDAYIIAERNEQAAEVPTEAETPAPRRRGRRIPRATSSATAVARSAGG